MRETVHVALGARSYDILIGPGLLDDAASVLAPYLKRPHVGVITDETVSHLHGERLTTALHAGGITAECLSLPAGEATKSWSQLQACVDWILDKRFERDDLILAFGGGVIGDLAGFAASIARRGLPFVQIPTSLLAQVDSSVGGKTGINTHHGKNLVGVFAQPQMVLADTGLLSSLPARDFLAGYGEVVKYGLLGDGEFFNWLEENGPDLASGDMQKRIYAVRRSCEMKAEIVAEDEREQGRRALLNLGHTFCHALEAATGYSDRLLHGEGVAIGCALAFETSMRLGLCSQEAPSRVRAHLRAMGMKTDLRDIDGSLPDADHLVELMYQDKKVSDGAIRFIMARDIGDSFVTKDVDLEIVKSVLKDASD